MLFRCDTWWLYLMNGLFQTLAHNIAHYCLALGTLQKFKVTSRLFFYRFCARLKHSEQFTPLPLSFSVPVWLCCGGINLLPHSHKHHSGRLRLQLVKLGLRLKHPFCDLQNKSVIKASSEWQTAWWKIQWSGNAVKWRSPCITLLPTELSVLVISP